MKCTTCNTDLPNKASAYCPRCDARQPFGPVYDDYAYQAFISYRHQPADSAIALRLHRAIESYRLPNHIAERHGSRKVGRVFRDQDELPALDSLPKAIDNALQKSRTLIVVCTPTTKDSVWVQREIEAFASYHGRERIIAVVADGQSTESLPPFLTAIDTVDENGQLHQKATEPLAADLRDTSRKSFNREKLRIIASIVGCNFDDLVQRDKKRHLKKGCAASMAGAVLSVALVALSIGLYSSLQQAALVEARHLSTLSLDAYEDGRRIEAERMALAALDAASRGGGHNLVPEAQHALEVASGAYLSAETSWIPNDSRLIAGAQNTFAASRDAFYYAFVDSDLNAVVYMTLLEKPIATIPLPLGKGNEYDRDPRNWKLTIAGQYLIATNPSNSSSGMFGVYDMSTNEEIFCDALYADAHDISSISMSGMLASVDRRAEELVCSYVSLAMGVCSSFPSAVKLKATSDASKPIIATCHKYYGAFAAGSTIAVFDAQRYRESFSTQSAFPTVSAMRWCNESLVVASYDAHDTGEGKAIDFAVQAFTPELELLWQRQGSYEIAPNGTERRSSIPDATPQLAYSSPDAPYVLMSAGATVYSLSATDGAMSEAYAAKSPVVTLSNAATDDGQSFTAIASANGDIAVCEIQSGYSLAPLRSSSLTLPTTCKDAWFGFSRKHGFEIIARSASEEGRMFSYRSHGVNSGYMDDALSDARLEGDFSSFTPVADHSLVIGSSDDPQSPSIGVFDGDSLELLSSFNPAEVIGTQTEEIPIRRYLSNYDPDIMYLLPWDSEPLQTESFIENTFKAGELFAYSLHEQKVIAKSTATVSSFEESRDIRSTLPLGCSTTYGLHVYRVKTEADSNCINDSLIVLDPRTLEPIRETPYDQQKVVFAAWALEQASLVGFMNSEDVLSAHGNLELIDGQTGNRISADLDSHAPYELYVNEVSCIAINDKATRLAVACDDDKLRCFDLPSGSLRWECSFAGQSSRNLRFEFGGDLLFAQDESGKCQFFDSRTGEVKGASEESIPYVNEGRFTQDGATFLATCKQENDWVPTLYTLSNVGGRIGIASVLNGVAFASTKSRAIVEFITPNVSIRASHFSIDELYRIVKTALEIDGAAIIRESAKTQSDEEKRGGDRRIEGPIAQSND